MRTHCQRALHTSGNAAKAKETPPRCWFQSERRARRIMLDVRFCSLNFWVCDL